MRRIGEQGKNRKNLSGKNIRKFRIEKNMSIEEVSKLLETMDIHISQNSLFEIEEGKRKVFDFEIVGFVEVFGIEAEDLFK